MGLFGLERGSRFDGGFGSSGEHWFGRHFPRLSVIDSCDAQLSPHSFSLRRVRSVKCEVSVLSSPCRDWHAALKPVCVRAFSLALLWTAATGSLSASQWTNRYPKVDGYGHHVYLEGYELPTLANGPLDAVPSPDGTSVAFAHRGWLWLMNLEDGIAVRLTKGKGVDSRPAWHPEGRLIAFVRDNGRDTGIYSINTATGIEALVVDSPALDLDPAYSGDGGTLYFTSGMGGPLDLWAISEGEVRQVTDHGGISMKPQPLPDGSGLLYLAKRGGNRVELLRFGGEGTGGRALTLVEGNIASMARPALSPSGALFAVNWPTSDGWELRIHSVQRPESPIALASGLPLAPAWSPDEKWIYYSEAKDDETLRLMKTSSGGGTPREVVVRSWDWGEEMGTLRVVTRTRARKGPAPARVAVLDKNDHPMVPESGQAHFDGANGRVFFYSPGATDLLLPAGIARISAVQGLAAPEEVVEAEIIPGATTVAEIELDPLWDAPAEGWTSADLHLHLNYGGPYQLSPEDIAPKMLGEALDVATPLLANLHNRFEDQALWGWRRTGEGPNIRIGQEVRSHFLGHMGLIGTSRLHWPWIWGPGYEVYGADDRTNGEVLDFAHAQGGLGYYVHPVGVSNPFAPQGRARVPISLVADAVLGDVDLLELLCLWSSAPGTVSLWHEFLNLGIPVAPSAGTDVMLNLYRTMAVGAVRVFVRAESAQDWSAFLRALKEGRSFASNGPYLDFQILDASEEEEAARPGDATEGSRTAAWTLELATASEVDTVDILVNGRVAHSALGLARPGRRSISGTLELPEAGWVAARARGGATRWPSMDEAPFAHTGPVWIGEVGSTVPEARRRAAERLLLVLESSRQRLRVGYGGAPIPNLLARFAHAEERLRELAR